MPVSIRESVNVPGAMPNYGYYSSSIVFTPGRLLFVSGQVAIDEDGNTVGVGDVRAQFEFILSRIQKIIEYNGGKLSDIVQERVFVTDVKFHKELRPIRMKHFPESGPASIFVIVQALPHDDLLLSMEVIAALP